MANAKETRSVKNNIGLALFILILVAMFFIPTSETLTAAGRNSLGLLLATIVCMLTGGLPIGVLCMLVIPLMYICGCVETPAAALAGFQNQSAFFMLASFGLTCAVTRVPLSRRLMRGIITKAGRNVNTVLLAIMLCCGLLPSFPISPPARRSSRWCWISSASMKMRTSASAPAAACSSPCPPLP